MIKHKECLWHLGKGKSCVSRDPQYQLWPQQQNRLNTKVENRYEYKIFTFASTPDLHFYWCFQRFSWSVYSVSQLFKSYYWNWKSLFVRRSEMFCQCEMLVLNHSFAGRRSSHAWRWPPGHVENTATPLWTQMAGGKIRRKCDVNSFRRLRRFTAFKSCRDWIEKRSANRLLLSVTSRWLCVCPEATW